MSSSHPELPALVSEITRRGATDFQSIALSHSTQQLTYADLHRYSQGFAAQLKERDLKSGERVVLALENSFEYVICFFGCLAAGAVVVPVNPDTTIDRLESILDDCTARLCIGRGAIAQQLSLKRSDVLVLQTTFEKNLTWFDGPTLAPTSTANADDIALILYTSGSTGRPKGVMLSHRNLMANTASIIEYLKLTQEDSTVTVLPFYYSFGNSILLTHLAVGGRIAIENRLAFPNTVVETLQREKPTGFSGVPYTYYILLGRSKFPDWDWSFLRYIAQAGGGLRVEAVRQLQRVLPGTQIFVMYGQTEASARLTYLPPDRLNEKLGSVGVGIPGVEIAVVNDAGQPVQTGEVGEVVARGQNVMRSYWNLPEESANTVREGWLYTGDMGRLDEDRFLFLVSRKSDFIKSASYRISPGEIEEVLAECPGVIDVAAFGVEDELLGEAVAACVVPAADAELKTDELRQHCLRRLPFFKVPKYIFLEASIPRTASGKTKYFMLREKYHAYGRRSSDGAAV